VPAYLAGRDLPRQPWKIDSMEAARRVFDGYDTGVKYADDHIGHIFDALKKAGLWDNTAIIISADHGEALGELNVYGDHQCADHVTCRVPMIVRWPGVTDAMAGRAFDALHYQNDCAATFVELAGGRVENWDGESFAGFLRAGRDEGRDSLVLSQGAWCVQRGVRWGDWLLLRTWHDAWHDYPPEMLFNVACDPHEQQDLASERPDLVREGVAKLAAWRGRMLERGCGDPLDTVLAEGGSLHAREAGHYLERLRATDRASLAEKFATRVLPVSTT
jgi:arylsulfatase A-like enzyme